MTVRASADDSLAAPSPADRVRARANWRAEMLRYLACSALALAADTGVYTLSLALGAGWALAAAFGFAVGLGVAYTLSVRLVFAHRRIADARIEFATFAAVGLFGLLLTEAMLWLLIARLHVTPLPAKLITAGCVFSSNFALRKLLLFTHRPATP